MPLVFFKRLAQGFKKTTLYRILYWDQRDQNMGEWKYWVPESSPAELREEGKWQGWLPWLVAFEAVGNLRREKVEYQLLKISK